MGSEKQQNKFVLVPLSLWQSNLDKLSDTQTLQNVPINITTPATQMITAEEHDAGGAGGGYTKDEQMSFDRIMNKVTNFALPSKSTILTLMFDNPRVSFSLLDDSIIIDSSNTNIPAQKFLNEIVIQGSKKQLPDVYFTLLNLLKVPSHLVKNHHAITKDRGDWIPFRK